jgi:hypothetical protein
VGIGAGPVPRRGLEPELDDPLDVRAAMADWDARFMRWQHDQGLAAMRESDNPDTRALAANCNCKPRPVPGRGRVGLG